MQEAVVRSRDEWWLRAYEQNPNVDDASIELAAGIQRLGALIAVTNYLTSRRDLGRDVRDAAIARSHPYGADRGRH